MTIILVLMNVAKISDTQCTDERAQHRTLLGRHPYSFKNYITKFPKKLHIMHRTFGFLNNEYQLLKIGDKSSDCVKLLTKI